MYLGGIQSRSERKPGNHSQMPGGSDFLEKGNGSHPAREL